jgi:hypothetical protein
MCRIIERQEQILQHLREPKALHVIIFSRNDVIHINYTCERVIDSQILCERIRSCFGSVDVFGVTSGAPGVEVGLEDFGAEDVVWGWDVETILVVEGLLVVGDGVAGEGAVVGDEAEDFWADSGAARKIWLEELLR